MFDSNNIKGGRIDPDIDGIDTRLSVGIRLILA